MKNKPVLFFSAIIILSSFVIVFYQLDNRPVLHVHNQGTDQNFQQILNVYRDNCARCHGAFGEGFASNPELRGKKTPVENVKQIIKQGIGKMPAFPNIQEPLLTRLSEFVSKL